MRIVPIVIATIATFLLAATVGPLRAAAADKLSTAQFLAECRTDAASCRRDVATMAEVSRSTSAACIPSELRQDDLTNRVRAQIQTSVAEDPSIATDDYEDSALGAIGELWPCTD
jgi:hypothetical protein